MTRHPPILFFTQRSLLALALLGASAAAHAQMTPPPANVVQLSASGFKEVQQDWLSMSLNTTKEGPDAVTVQNQLKVALEQALAIARPQARPGGLEVRTGGFGLTPRYGRDGQINGWQGTAELVLEGGAGVGSAILPSSNFKTGDRPDVLKIPLVQPSVKRKVVLLQRQRGGLSPAAEAFHVLLRGMSFKI